MHYSGFWGIKGIRYTLSGLLCLPLRSTIWPWNISTRIGMDDPQLEALVLQWRRTLEPEQRKAISADIQRRMADQLEWVNVTTYPFFQAYRTATVKDFPFYNQALLLLDTTWLEK